MKVRVRYNDGSSHIYENVYEIHFEVNKNTYWGSGTYEMTIKQLHAGENSENIINYVYGEGFDILHEY